MSALISTDISAFSYNSSHEKKTWHLGASASGDDSLKKAPLKAHFHRETGLYAAFTRDELEQQIASFKARGASVPKEYQEALESLDNR